MKILIVGASGFVGKHLVRHLVQHGHEIEAWSRRPDTTLNMPGVHWRTVDLLRDPLPLPSIARWDAAFHLAAHSRPSLAWTRQTVIENLDMTAKILDHLASQMPGCRMILASSAHVYAPSKTPIRETDPIAPTSPYGLSKQLSEIWASSLIDRLDLQVTRAFNQIGPDMPPGLLLPDLLDRLSLDEPCLIMNGRNDIKDFLDIRDALEAYEALLTVAAPSGSVWNLCSGHQISVLEFIQALLDQMGIKREVSFASQEVHHLVGDSTRIQRTTGWRPKHTLQETLRYSMGGVNG